MKEWLNNRVAVITEASSGLGKAIVYALSRKGCHVVISSRNKEKLMEIEKDLSHSRNSVISIPADVTDPASVRRMVEETIEHFARIDYLICNADEYFRCSVVDSTLALIQKAMNVNYFGTLNCIFEVLPHMLRRGKGHVIIVSSMDAKKGIPPDSAYVASKTAIASYADVMRQELKPYGINVSSIFIARVDTPMISDLEVSFISAKIKPEKVARAIVKAMEYKKREIIIPKYGPRLLIILNCFSPALGDWLVKFFRLSGKERKNH